ncbi:MAG: division/cell wall cluster transcriptional repressor MraZ [Bacteroidetes bacterium]|nr:division/cell wall cluster transcriptional repressor MraZ [Bacteroidota bacterium]
MLLLGEYEVAIDSKGRLLVPAGFRKQLPEGQGERFVVSRGFEPCLTLYPMNTWNELADQIKQLNPFNEKVRMFKRLFLNGATHVEVDTAGRILIPKQLQEYGGFKKELVFTGQGDKVELWDMERYYEHMQQHSTDFPNLANELLGGDFMNPFDKK